MPTTPNNYPTGIWNATSAPTAITPASTLDLPKPDLMAQFDKADATEMAQKVLTAKSMGLPETHAPTWSDAIKPSVVFPAATKFAKGLGGVGAGAIYNVAGQVMQAVPPVSRLLNKITGAIGSGYGTPVVPEEFGHWGEGVAEMGDTAFQAGLHQMAHPVTSSSFDHFMDDATSKLSRIPAGQTVAGISGRRAADYANVGNAIAQGASALLPYAGPAEGLGDLSDILLGTRVAAGGGAKAMATATTGKGVNVLSHALGLGRDPVAGGAYMGVEAARHLWHPLSTGSSAYDKIVGVTPSEGGIPQYQLASGSSVKISDALNSGLISKNLQDPTSRDATRTGIQTLTDEFANKNLPDSVKERVAKCSLEAGMIAAHRARLHEVEMGIPEDQSQAHLIGDEISQDYRARMLWPLALRRHLEIGTPGSVEFGGTPRANLLADTQKGLSDEDIGDIDSHILWHYQNRFKADPVSSPITAASQSPTQPSAVSQARPAASSVTVAQPAAQATSAVRPIAPAPLAPQAAKHFGPDSPYTQAAAMYDSGDKPKAERFLLQNPPGWALSLLMQAKLGKDHPLVRAYALAAEGKQDEAMALLNTIPEDQIRQFLGG